MTDNSKNVDENDTFYNEVRNIYLKSSKINEEQVIKDLDLIFRDEFRKAAKIGKSEFTFVLKDGLNIMNQVWKNSYFESLEDVFQKLPMYNEKMEIVSAAPNYTKISDMNEGYGLNVRCRFYL